MRDFLTWTKALKAGKMGPDDTSFFFFLLFPKMLPFAVVQASDPAWNLEQILTTYSLGMLHSGLHSLQVEVVKIVLLAVDIGPHTAAQRVQVVAEPPLLQSFLQVGQGGFGHVTHPGSPMENARKITLHSTVRTDRRAQEVITAHEVNKMFNIFVLQFLVEFYFLLGMNAIHFILDKGELTHEFSVCHSVRFTAEC